MDEHGRTAGILTFKEVWEEIVGEIRNEFDEMRYLSFKIAKENPYTFDSKVFIDIVNDLLGINIEETDIDTLDGWMLLDAFQFHVNLHQFFGLYRNTKPLFMAIYHSIE